jgi:hypothetical protein
MALVRWLSSNRDILRHNYNSYSSVFKFMSYDLITRCITHIPVSLQFSAWLIMHLLIRLFFHPQKNGCALVFKCFCADKNGNGWMKRGDITDAFPIYSYLIGGRKDSGQGGQRCEVSSRSIQRFVSTAAKCETLLCVVSFRSIQLLSTLLLGVSVTLWCWGHRVSASVAANCEGHWLYAPGDSPLPQSAFLLLEHNGC